MANDQNLIHITSETAAELGSKGGKAKKGSKHITTYIQELMEDEEFEANVLDAKKGLVEYKGAPIKAIIKVATTKAINGDAKAMDWLAKYGWSSKTEVDVTSLGEQVGAIDPTLSANFAEWLKGK